MDLTGYSVLPSPRSGSFFQIQLRFQCGPIGLPPAPTVLHALPHTDGRGVTLLLARIFRLV